MSSESKRVTREDVQGVIFDLPIGVDVTFSRGYSAGIAAARGGFLAIFDALPADPEPVASAAAGRVSPDASWSGFADDPDVQSIQRAARLGDFTDPEPASGEADAAWSAVHDGWKALGYSADDRLAMEAAIRSQSTGTQPLDARTRSLLVEARSLAFPFSKSPEQRERIVARIDARLAGGN